MKTAFWLAGCTSNIVACILMLLSHYQIACLVFSITTTLLITSTWFHE